MVVMKLEKKEGGGVGGYDGGYGGGDLRGGGGDWWNLCRKKVEVEKLEVVVMKEMEELGEMRVNGGADSRWRGAIAGGMVMAASGLDGGREMGFREG